jgi:hypothetical protein
MRFADPGDLRSSSVDESSSSSERGGLDLQALPSAKAFGSSSSISPELFGASSFEKREDHRSSSSSEREGLRVFELNKPRALRSFEL